MLSLASGDRVLIAWVPRGASMASVVLLHSVLGLRLVELAAAGMIRRAGHSALTPDL